MKKLLYMALFCALLCTACDDSKNTRDTIFGARISHVDVAVDMDDTSDIDFTYDQSGFVTRMEFTEAKEIEPVKSARTMSYTDGYLTEVIDMQWNYTENEWVNSDRDGFEYDEKKRLSAEVDYNLNPAGEWVLNSRKTYSYTEDNFISEIIVYSVVDGVVENPAGKTSYTYSEDSSVCIKSESTWNTTENDYNEAVITRKFKLNFDKNQKLQNFYFSTPDSIDDDTWINQSYFSYTYDNEGRCTSASYYDWNSSYYQTQDKKSISYDSMGNRTEITDYRSDYIGDGIYQFIIDSTENYTNKYNGNKLSTLSINGTSSYLDFDITWEGGTMNAEYSKVPVFPKTFPYGVEAVSSPTINISELADGDIAGFLYFMID